MLKKCILFVVLINSYAQCTPTLRQEVTSSKSDTQPIANYEQDPTSHRCAVATKGMTEKQIEMGLQQDDPWQRVADRVMSKRGANPAPLVVALCGAVIVYVAFLSGNSGND
jgi:hypothetical protein